MMDGLHCCHCGRRTDTSPCSNCGQSPFPIVAAHNSNTEQPVSLIGLREREMETDGDNRAFILPDRRTGFAVVLLAIGYGVERLAPLSTVVHGIRVDLFAGAVPFAAGAPQYVLFDAAGTFFTVLSDGYAGIPVPMHLGGAQPYGVRVEVAAIRPNPLPPERKVLRVAWGYRAYLGVETPGGGQGV